MSITVSNVKELIPVNSGVISDTLIQAYINIVSEEADLQLRNIFATPLTPVLEADCINYTTQNTYGSQIIAITAWQEAGLTLKISSKENTHLATLTEIPLVLGQDYVLWYGWKGNKIPGKPLPVTNIILLGAVLSRYSILRAYGTYGWQAGYPSDVKQALYNVIVSLAGYATQTANQGGVTGLTREKSMTTEVEFDSSMAESLRNQARYLLNDPAFVAIIQKYTVVTENQLAII